MEVEKLLTLKHADLLERKWTNLVGCTQGALLFNEEGEAYLLNQQNSRLSRVGGENCESIREKKSTFF